MIGWTGHMTSLDSLTVSVDCDICKWVSLIGKYCYAFSAGKLLAASSLHCVNCRLNLNPCFFTYCTCHVTISTSCVWLKGWFNPLCLLQSIAISRIHSSLILNQKMRKQQTCVAYMWAYSHGCRKRGGMRGPCPPDFEIIGNKRLFLQLRGVKTKFHHFWPPPGKKFGKIPYCPPMEKILPMPMLTPCVDICAYAQMP